MNYMSAGKTVTIKNKTQGKLKWSTIPDLTYTIHKIAH